MLNGLVRGLKIMTGLLPAKEACLRLLSLALEPAGDTHSWLMCDQYLVFQFVTLKEDGVAD